MSSLFEGLISDLGIAGVGMADGGFTYQLSLRRILGLRLLLLVLCYEVILSGVWCLPPGVGGSAIFSGEFISNDET